MKTRLSELLKEIDRTNKIWDNIPKVPDLTSAPCYDEIDWTEDDLTMSYFGRFDLSDDFNVSDKPVVRPVIEFSFEGDKNEEC